MTNRKTVIENLLQNLHIMRHKLMSGYAMQGQAPITPSQGCVLRFVAKNSQVNVKHIAQAMHVTSSAATQLINGLVENGYLVRKTDEGDRRVSTLVVSEKAKKLLHEMRGRHLERMTELFSVLTDEELARFAELNSKILKNLDQE